VHEDSPAEKAGLKAGDVIVEVEGHDIDDTGELREEMAEHDGGESVAITWLRQGKSMSASITPRGRRFPERILVLGCSDSRCRTRGIPEF
jgi:serine protease Do